jgi:hypothetical protein
MQLPPRAFPTDVCCTVCARQRHAALQRPDALEKEIAAVTGHTTLKEVARYTRAADQKRLAAGAVAKLTEQKPDENSQPSKSGWVKQKKDESFQY